MFELTVSNVSGNGRHLDGRQIDVLDTQRDIPEQRQSQ